MSKNKANASCPCDSGKAFSNCCEHIINDVLPASSAEALMRSRYTAYVLQNEQYLLNSWHHSSRPQFVDIDTTIQWLRLKIISSDVDHVEFLATYRMNGKAFRLHENSRFIYEDGKWFYVDGVIEPDTIQNNA